MAQSVTKKAETQGECKLWWVLPALVGGAIAAIVVPYLHIRFGSGTFPREAPVVIGNLVIFAATYLFFRRLHMPHSSTFVGFIVSLVVALPVFAIAFFGLGYEIPELFDFGLMYILGSWVGSSEIAECLARAEAAEEA